jgi:hypothetical protein
MRERNGYLIAYTATRTCKQVEEAPVIGVRTYARGMNSIKESAAQDEERREYHTRSACDPQVGPEGIN